MTDAGPTVRAIREAELEACLDLWTTVWPQDGRPYFARYFYGDPDFQPEYTRVCVVDGRIVSAAHIVKRVVSCGEFTLTMGGIANVVTLPEYRRRGYSTLCLQQAIQVMEADAMDLSLLFTGTHPLYEPLGWERAPSQFLLGSIRRELAGVCSPPQVREYRESDDAAIHDVYQRFNLERPGAVRRSEAYWRDWIGLWRGRFGGRAVVAEEDGGVAGYCLYRVDVERGITRIAEVGWSGTGGDVVQALLIRAAIDSRNAGVEQMAVPLHENAGVASAAKLVFGQTELRVSDSAMVRLLHRDNLLRGLAPALTMRWMEAGSPAGSLVFDGPYGASRIHSNRGFLKVEEVDAPACALRQSDLFQMLIGRGSVSCVPADQAAFAAALFPRQEPWFWALDGF